jgi:hypothetical protein
MFAKESNTMSHHLGWKRIIAAAAFGLGVTGSAVAAAPLQHKSASMQCLDRRISVEADCFPHSSFTMCTRQSIRFSAADGKALGARSFKASPTKGADHPTVDEQFGELSCVETKARNRFVVALMDNGGNCEQCEWVDVYSLDGVLVGSTRNGKKLGAEPDAAVTIAFSGSGKGVLSHQALTDLYKLAPPRTASAGMTSARDTASVPDAYSCPVLHVALQKVSRQTVDEVSQSLDKAFSAALGPDSKRLFDDKVFARVAARTVDERRMAELAEVSGCAALIDERGGCALYFDTELGNPLSVFMAMKKTAPMRRQFESAIARVRTPELKRAAQACIKLISSP